jgi:hypothetical protein
MKKIMRWEQDTSSKYNVFTMVTMVTQAPMVTMVIINEDEGLLKSTGASSR